MRLQQMVTLGFATVVFASCEALPKIDQLKQMYPGERKPSDQVAIIGPGEETDGVKPFLWGIGGEAVYSGPWIETSTNLAEVLSGEHYVQAGLGWISGSGLESFATFVVNMPREAMIFEAQAGHRYLVFASSPSEEVAKRDGITAWIVDLDTQEEVARSNARPGSREGVSFEEILELGPKP